MRAQRSIRPQNSSWCRSICVWRRARCNTPGFLCNTRIADAPPPSDPRKRAERAVEHAGWCLQLLFWCRIHGALASATSWLDHRGFEARKNASRPTHKSRTCAAPARPLPNVLAEALRNTMIREWGLEVAIFGAFWCALGVVVSPWQCHLPEGQRW